MTDLDHPYRCPTCGTHDPVVDLAGRVTMRSRQALDDEAERLRRRSGFSILSGLICLIMAGLNGAFVVAALFR
jgi:hypothetical protein